MPFELSVDLTTLAILAVVAFIAGFIEAIAGGGGLLTTPAMLTAGMPPHLVLGTNKLSSTFGSATASFTFYRRKLFHPRQWVHAIVGTLIGALAGATGITERGALGIIETFSAASIVVASDAAVKAADVQLLDVRVALGLGGKGYALMTGDVAAVQAAVAAGEAVTAESGLLIASVVIPRPAPQVWDHILGAGVGA